MFEKSDWLTFPEVEANITRSTFTVHGNVKSAQLNITALGYFECMMNGKKVGTDRLVPAMTDYEQRDLSCVSYPIRDTLSHTLYYLTYDVTSDILDGENVLAAEIGSGWYGQYRSPNEGMPRWGDNMLVFELNITFEDGSAQTVVSSSANTVWKVGVIRECQLYTGEYHDLTKFEDGWFMPGFDISSSRGWQKAATRKPLDAKIKKKDFPCDRVIRSIVPEKIYSRGDITVYDLKETASGVGVIRFAENVHENLLALVRYADVLNDDMSLNFHYVGGEERMQRDMFLSDRRFAGKDLYPRFTWHAGRYVEVVGRAELVRFDVIQTPLEKTATFTCGNKVLQWLFDTYVLTQQANVHGCVPSDCPHRERLGYTGDGQLTCDTVMTVFDAKSMYHKWMHDIRDCQDINNGHVQHTAPFYGGGGGPGGWGGAAVIVPWTFYEHYGDIKELETALPSMKKYISYMLTRCEDGLVVREEEGGWCLGDWVPPFNNVLLPEPFVNTYYLAKCSDMLSRACLVFSQTDESEKYRLICENAKKAITAHYYNEKTGSFLEGVQGADAFALDIGIGDERTLRCLVDRYEKLGTFDTGIFGTEILIRVLFEKGMHDLAFRLLVNEAPDSSFGGMMNSGATTLWENWNGCDSRCHPMYGAVVTCIFRHILGIKKENGEITVKPAFLPQLGDCEGSVIIGDKRVFAGISYKDGQQLVRTQISPV